ncbi:hypothetical protein V6767_22800, partial [Martelella sp. FLE1502]
EGVELLILAVRGGIDCSSLGVTVTTQLFGFAECFGQQDTALAIGVGANTLGKLLTLGAMLARLTLPLG